MAPFCQMLASKYRAELHLCYIYGYFLCQVVLLNICKYFCRVVYILMAGNCKIEGMFDNLTTGVLMVGNLVT